MSLAAARQRSKLPSERRQLQKYDCSKIEFSKFLRKAGHVSAMHYVFRSIVVLHSFRLKLCSVKCIVQFSRAPYWYKDINCSSVSAVILVELEVCEKQFVRNRAQSSSELVLCILLRGGPLQKAQLVLSNTLCVLECSVQCFVYYSVFKCILCAL